MPPAAPAPKESLDQLLIQLRRLTPMPEDERITPPLLMAYDKVLRKISDRGPEDAKVIQPMLASFGPGLARGAYERACTFFRAFPDEVAGPQLQYVAERSSSVPARVWAVRTLGEMGWLPAEETLRIALEDDALAVRKAADLALRRIEAQKPAPEEEDDGPDPLFDGIAQA